MMRESLGRSSLNGLWVDDIAETNCSQIQIKTKDPSIPLRIICEIFMKMRFETIWSAGDVIV